MNKTRKTIRAVSLTMLFMFMLTGLIAVFPTLDSLDGVNDIGTTAEAATELKPSGIDLVSGTYDNAYGSQGGTVAKLYNGATGGGNNILSNAKMCYFISSSVKLRIRLNKSYVLSGIKIYDSLYYPNATSWNGIKNVKWSLDNSTWNDVSSYSVSMTTNGGNSGYAGTFTCSFTTSAKQFYIYFERAGGAGCGMTEIAALYTDDTMEGITSFARNSVAKGETTRPSVSMTAGTNLASVSSSQSLSVLMDGVESSFFNKSTDDGNFWGTSRTANANNGSHITGTSGATVYNYSASNISYGGSGFNSGNNNDTPYYLFYENNSGTAPSTKSPVKMYYYWQSNTTVKLTVDLGYTRQVVRITLYGVVTAGTNYWKGIKDISVASTSGGANQVTSISATGTGAINDSGVYAGETVVLTVNTMTTRYLYLSFAKGASLTPGGFGFSEIQVGGYGYEITYNANGGSGAPSQQYKTYGQSHTLSSTVPTRSGYTFTGWNTAADGNGTSYASGGTYSANALVTLYAQWAPQYTVVYNKGTGSGSAMSNSTFTYGVSSTLRANTYTKSGYSFAGWWLSRSSDSKVLWYNTVEYNATTIGASWYTTSETPANKMRGYYNDQRTVTELTDSPGDTVTLTAQWNPNYTFSSANTSYGTVGTASLNNITTGGTVTVSGNTLTVPVWTYDTSAKRYKSVNTTVTATAKTGYKFEGWYIGGVKQTSNFTVSDPKAIEARWEEITYTVILKLGSKSWGQTPDIPSPPAGFTADHDGTSNYYYYKEVTYTESFTMPEPRRGGHLFTRWTYSSNTYTVGSSYNKLSSTDGATVTITAVWQYTVEDTVIICLDGEEYSHSGTAITFDLTMGTDTANKITGKAYAKMGDTPSDWYKRGTYGVGRNAQDATVDTYHFTLNYNSADYEFIGAKYDYSDTTRYTMSEVVSDGSDMTLSQSGNVYSGSGVNNYSYQTVVLIFKTKNTVYVNQYLNEDYGFGLWSGHFDGLACDPAAVSTTLNVDNNGSYVDAGLTAYKGSTLTFTGVGAGNGGCTAGNSPSGYAFDAQPAANFTLKGYTVINNGPVPGADSTPYSTVVASMVPLNGATSFTATVNGTTSIFWIIETNYTVTYDLNGGKYNSSTTNPTQTYAWSDTVTLLTPTRDGYTFAGWKMGGTAITSSNNTKLSSTAGDSVTLTAQWDPISYTVTLNKNATDATAGTASVSATYDAAMPTSSVTMPTRSGWTFDGYWDTNAATGGTKYYNANGTSARTWNKTSNTTLYARWYRNITFYSGSSKHQTDTVAQYWNGSNSTNASISTPTPEAISTWTFRGWRTDTTAVDSTTSGTITPSTDLTYYAVYTRTATFYSGYNSSANTTASQYYNTNGAYSVTTPSSATTPHSSGGWSFLGWRDDTTAGDKETAGGSASDSSSQTFYAVFSRTGT
ncbi:MAG: InlB B-repeat-containing protein, partial [Clostridia bacterium]|nr:InlB B-repeat-containing protein [Clostridia bacterium]